MFIPQDAFEDVVTSDTSESWGCGACHNLDWFQNFMGQDDKITSNCSKKLKKEIIIKLIILAACIWVYSWSRGKVIACYDSVAVVAVLNCKKNC